MTFTNHLMFNQFEVSDSDYDFVVSTWKNIYSKSSNRCLYADENKQSLLEIILLETVPQFEKEINSKEQFIFEEGINKCLK